MTSTTSFKDNLKNAFSIFKWELKNRRTSLIVYTILAAVFTSIALTICLSVSLTATDTENAVQGAALIFQLVSCFFVFGLTAVFTIIYTAGNYSYLHNKRKVDMYGSLPIGSRTLYLAKTVSAYLCSVVPALAFFGTISLISFCMGQPPVRETIEMYIHLLIGPVACISFYGLLAICCGTTAHSVISFIAVCVSYPIAAKLVHSVFRSFFYGLPPVLSGSSFLFNALNPIDAYRGNNALYWLLFTAVCVALGVLLAKKRRSERAQNSFAFFLPAHIVKLIVPFIIGMVLGVLFGSLNVFGNGMAGFAFGFLLGAVPACVILHLIYYKNFDVLLKSSIPFAVMSVLTIAVIGFFCADLLGYNSFIPDKNDIKSAGVVFFNDVSERGGKTATSFAKDCADDFSDSEKIGEVVEVHKKSLEGFTFSPREKFINVWTQTADETINSITDYNYSYCVSYRLTNGRAVTRFYSGMFTRFRENSEEMNYSDPEDSAQTIRSSPLYKRSYSGAARITPDKVIHMIVSEASTAIEDSDESSVNVNAAVLDNDDKTAADVKKLMSAIQNDTEEFKVKDDSEKIATVNLRYRTALSDQFSFLRFLLDVSDTQNGDTCQIDVYDSDVNTVGALREIGVLDKNNRLNENGKYYHKAETDTGSKVTG